MSTWTVPGYTDLRELGRSPTGRAVLARHTATGVHVTIKYLADGLRADEEYLPDYRRDARRLAALDSPQVAPLYEYVEASDGAATVREYVDGVALRALLGATPKLDPRSALAVLAAAVRALAAAHDQGVTHGGFQPDNVLVDRAGRSKVADFAVAPTAGTPAGDLGAAITSFLECLTGQGAPAIELVPKRLRAFVQAATANPAALTLADLEAVAAKAYGAGWEPAGQAKLALLVERQLRRKRRDG